MPVVFLDLLFKDVDRFSEDEYRYCTLILPNSTLHTQYTFTNIQKYHGYSS